ncbi:MAG: HAMP domain-containing histidine kinase [Schleiferiaceae bacterium]|nr:HAMP domain-containing histidine kinase [Schleiferiaceae bacterium]
MKNNQKLLGRLIWVWAFVFYLGIAKATSYGDFYPLFDNIEKAESLVYQSRANTVQYADQLIRLELSRSFCHKAGKDTAEIRELVETLDYPFGKIMYDYIILNLRGEFTNDPVGKLNTLNKVYNFFGETNDTSGLIRAAYLLGYFHKNFADAFEDYKIQHRNFFEEMLGISQEASLPEDQLTGALLYLIDAMQSGWDLEDDKERELIDGVYSLLEKMPKYFRGWSLYNEFMGMRYLSGKHYNPEKATQHFRAILADLENDCSIAFLHKYKNSLGFALLMNDSIEAASLLFKENIEFYKRNQLPADAFLLGSFSGQAYVFEKLGAFEDAIQFRNQTDSIKQVLDIEKQKAITVKYAALLELNRKEEKIKQLVEKSIIDRKTIYLISGLQVVILVVLTALGFALRKLRKQRKALKELLINRDLIFTVIAHDLRGPIFSYQNLAESMIYFHEIGETQKVKKIAEEVDATGRSLKLLVENFLHWGRAQQIHVQKEMVEVAPIFKELMQLYNGSLLRKKITPHFSLSEQSVVVANKIDLETIFRNLIDNAIKYGAENSQLQIASWQSVNDEFVLTIKNISTLAQEEKIAHINSSILGAPHFKTLRSNTHLGLQIVKLLLDNNEITGNISFDRLTKEVMFTLVFKK